MTDCEASAKTAMQTVLGFSPKAQFEVLMTKELIDPRYDVGMILIEGIHILVKKCIENNTALLMATPDFIFGEGTLDVFKKVGSDKGSCVTIAHLRVLPEILGEISEVPLSNAKLMGLGYKHAHSAWVKCERSCDPGMSYLGGISWQWVAEGIAAVRHYLPSPFYVNFTEEDVQTFKTNWGNKPPAFGLWDHVWPHKLIESGRLRYIGSSDAAMMIEVTDEYANIPPWNPPGKSNEDEYFRNEYQNHIQKQFVSVFRGE